MTTAQHPTPRNRPLRSTSLRAFAAAAAAAALLAVDAATAEAKPAHTVFRQLTQLTTGTIDSVKIRMQDAKDIAFVSNGDVMGPGTETATRQIYLWREDETGYGTITQVTNDETCESYDVARPTDSVFSDRPTIIAFVSTCDFDPLRDNSDHNPEIFFYEIDTGIFHQVTDTPAGVVNGDPFTSDSGRCLVFRSNGDLDDNEESHPHYDLEHPGPGYSNPDGSDEVFVYGKLNGGLEYPYTGVFTQMSNGPAGTSSSKPVINGYWFPRQCQTTAFQSTYDQHGTGFVGQGIYVYKMPMSALEPVTAAEIPFGFPNGIYANPSISGASPFARGPHVVFEAVPDLWRNNSQGRDIFDWRDFHPRMTQFTNVGAGYEAHEPQVGDGGGVIALSSNGEFLHPTRALRSGETPPFNADHNEEIFILEGRRSVIQVTNTTGCTSIHPSLKDDGDRLAFTSDCDIIDGLNPTNVPQVFLYQRQNADYPLLQPDACLEAEGCCVESRTFPTTCYHQLQGAKPKIARPNCIDKPQGCN